LYDEIDASLENVMDDIYEAYRRVLAIHEFRSDSDFEDLLISFKRMSNIIMGEDRFSFSKKLLMEKDEKELYNYFISIKDKIVQNIAVKNYNQVYSILSTFKPYVDNFFDNVLVMEKDLKLRGNRMGLLNSIISVFSDIIDISKIVSV
jgi:glycyl-tRNA synthetase beta chain